MSKKKIAVCLPTFNEAQNIVKITKKVDKSLVRLAKNYDCVIANADNNSPDHTNEIFRNTKTHTYKVSLISKATGKGENICNFLAYCKGNHIDYAFTIDADLKSYKVNWISKMLKELEKGNDFICPMYKRNRYEGNTTNHFVVPIIYAIYGKFIRQPIGGDYGFNRRFINLLCGKKIFESAKKYGIDIFMLLMALNENLEIKQVILGKKIHGDSSTKIEKIFMDVAKSLRDIMKKFSFIDTNLYEKNYKYVSISREKTCRFSNTLKEKYEKYDTKSYVFEDVKRHWRDDLEKYILNIDDYTDEKVEELSINFMKYVTSYWKKNSFSSAKKCEEDILKLCKNLQERVIENGIKN